MNPRTAALTLVGLMTSTPADAVYLYWRDRSVTYVPDELILIGVLLVGLAICYLMLAIEENTSSAPSVSQMSLDLPDEVRDPQSVEYYDDMTERTRALKRKLDADTELAESYINASRAKAALQDADQPEDATWPNRQLISRR